MTNVFLQRLFYGDYVFCQSTIKVWLNYSQKFLGLTVVATVCDQGTTNRSAIEGLVTESREWYIQNGEVPKRRIVIGNEELIPLYDVPHLLKGIRNNLVEKDLIWINGDQVNRARWSDIITAYEIDSSSNFIRCMPRISDMHVVKRKMKKMKVSHATQVMSHSVAAAISIMARHGKCCVKKYCNCLMLLWSFCRGNR